MRALANMVEVDDDPIS